MSSTELHELQQNVTESIADYPSAQEDDQLPMERFFKADFCAFIQAFLLRRRADPVWRILRYYGYNTELVLDRDYLHPRMSVTSDGSDTIELSQSGLDFLSDLWTDFHDVSLKHAVSDLPSLTHM
jgi:hypothetical protein